MTEKNLLKGVKGRSTVDFMLRTVQQHHVQLSMMADQKANILMGASFLILTITLSHFRTNGFSPGLLVLSIFTLLSAGFSLLAVMPSIPKKKFCSVNSPNFNPLFFSFFTNLELDEYTKHMREIISDDTKIYETFIKDTYQLGKILQKKKYRLLGYSYRIFLLGMVLSFIITLGELAFK